MRMLTSLAFAAAAVVSVAFVPQTASADKVCHEECARGVCRQECVETEGRGREDRAEHREDRREGRGEERREERREGPGVELRLPGVGIEVGR